VGFLRRRPSEPETDQPPDGLAMKIDGIFWVGAPPDAKLSGAQRAVAGTAPGTILAGELVGTGSLRPGDFVLHDGERFKIVRIEAFRENLERMQPPRNIGLVLGTQVEQERFSEGQELRFER
jgi:hypothetical protein